MEITLHRNYITVLGTDLHDLLAKYEEPAKKHLEGVTQNGKSLRDAIEDVVNPFEKEFGDDQTIKDAVKRLEGEQTRLKTNATATKKALESMFFKIFA